MGIFKRIETIVKKDDENIIPFVRKHYRYIILIFVIMILYISNGLIYDLELGKQNQLKEKLLRAKVRYNLKFQDFMEFNNYGKLLELSEKHGLNLEEPDKPPIRIKK